MNWNRPTNTQKKKFKIFIFGPPGSFKTRVALRLADNGNFDAPSLGVVDTEFGTDHYTNEFAFVVPPIKAEDMNAEKIHAVVEDVVKKPGNLRTLLIDSTSVYMDMVQELWLDRFRLREKTSAGNKGEYYTIQPRDYGHINRYVGKFIRTLLKCDMNIIATAQKKNEWGSDMKVIGETFDAWKRLPYYFDTIIEITENKSAKGPKWTAMVTQKDRSHSFALGEKIPWGSDEEAVAYMIKKMGGNLSGGDPAAGYDPETDATKAAAKTEPKPEVKPEVKPEKAEAAPEGKATPKVETKPEKAADPPKEEKPAEKSAEKPAEKTPETPKKEAVKEAPAKEEPAEKPKDAEDTSGPATTETLMKVVQAKKEQKINDKATWDKMVGKYGVTTARDMTENQAVELIKDILRGEIPT